MSARFEARVRAIIGSATLAAEGHPTAHGRLGERQLPRRRVREALGCRHHWASLRAPCTQSSAEPVARA
jgi:hypothetical protein